MIWLIAAAAVSDADLTFCCRPDNDLYVAVARTSGRCQRFDSAAQAFERAKPGSGVLILDGNDPIDVAPATKHLKLYRERPLPRDSKGALDTLWQRVIVTTDRFGPALPRARILSLGRQRLPVASAGDPWLVLGRVAGFDSLAFGMPKETFPLLFNPRPDVLESVAPLSRFSTARFGPAKAWKPVMREVLRWLGAPHAAAVLDWQPSVAPAYSEEGHLPKDVEQQAMRRSATWFTRSHLVLPMAQLPAYEAADQWPDRVGPAPMENGDGSLGMLEGYSSAIGADGTQPARWYRRADCNAESAMALALTGDPVQREVGRRIATFIAEKSRVIHDQPSKESFGLAGWNDLPPQRGTFYGDDNARYILGLIGASGALNETRWDDAILRCILANFRTTGVKGFRGDALSESDIERLGWKHYFNADTENLAPHFEAYLWACYLWAYGKTGYKPLLERAERAIERTMTAGENAWTWTNGIQQERARMLLPLSWLVRVSDTSQHRAWLNDTVAKVLEKQAKCGALREEIGDPAHGIAGPPRSNEAFGTAETPLLQENGDPLADMLYTTNFAFLGLHEAAAVTHDPKLVAAENKMAEFLCRIQIRSKSHPEFDGAWFRAFDFGDWEYWASNADLGWGAWSIESGWSVSWIASVLALRQRHEALWDVHPGFYANPAILKAMLPAE